MRFHEILLFFLQNLHFGKRLYSIITISCEKKYTCVRRTSLGEKSRLKSVRLSFEVSHVNVMLQFLTPSNRSFHCLRTLYVLLLLPNTNQQNFKCIIIIHTHLLHCIANMHYSLTFPKKPFKIISSNCFHNFHDLRNHRFTQKSKSLCLFFEGCESWLTFFHT